MSPWSYPQNNLWYHPPPSSCVKTGSGGWGWYARSPVLIQLSSNASNDSRGVDWSIVTVLGLLIKNSFCLLLVHASTCWRCFFENSFDNQSLTNSVHKSCRVMLSMLVVVLFNGSFKDDFLVDTFDFMVVISIVDTFWGPWTWTCCLQTSSP